MQNKVYLTPLLHDDGDDDNGKNDYAYTIYLYSIYIYIYIKSKIKYKIKVKNLNSSKNTINLFFQYIKLIDNIIKYLYSYCNL